MWRKHHILFQDHLKYNRNNIAKPFRVRILRYAECVQEMHDLAKYLSPFLVKGEILMKLVGKSAKKFSIHEIQVAIKDGLPSSIQDELGDNQEDYNTLTHEDWCDFLSTIEVKDNK